MSGHIFVVPTHVTRCEPDGEPRWCFTCRKHRSFTLTVHVPDDPMSYYGPHCSVSCEKGHTDGDCFPGTWREWSDYPEEAP